MNEVEPGHGSSVYWPERFIIVAWVALFGLSHFVFRDDESIGHHVLHAGLWISVAIYLLATVWEHRTAAQN